MSRIKKKRLLRTWAKNKLPADNDRWKITSIKSEGGYWDYYLENNNRSLPMLSLKSKPEGEAESP
jgi:hypothetical protein